MANQQTEKKKKIYLLVARLYYVINYSMGHHLWIKPVFQSRTIISNTPKNANTGKNLEASYIALRKPDRKEKKDFRRLVLLRNDVWKPDRNKQKDFRRLVLLTNYVIDLWFVWPKSLLQSEKLLFFTVSSISPRHIKNGNGLMVKSNSFLEYLWT